MTGQMRAFRARSLPKSDKPVFDVVPDDLSSEQPSIDGTSSSASFDRFCTDLLGDGSVGESPGEAFWDDDSTTTSLESSPIGWPLGRRERSRLGKLNSLPKSGNNRDAFVWEERKDKAEDGEVSELEMMKERFAKLLLGEDMSGGGKGVSTALAISNAITNLSASVFGELWQLEPFAPERKARWRREMECLLAVSDYIVEFVPSMQTLPDGSTMEVMVTKPRSDLHMNLPALRKLDTMLMESLDSFVDTEFWYLDRTVAMAENDGGFPQRQEEKWWLPTPRVPSNGLSDNARKQLQHQRECVNQILKAALAINGQVLSEMEVPTNYWEALPKNGRSSLGEALYRTIVSDHFAPEALISSLDSSNEHNTLELVNRVEAAIYIWRRKIQTKQMQTSQKDSKPNSKASWGLSNKDSSGDLERREVLAEKAETLLLLLRHKFPGLPQTILDVNKIQHNKDVGQSILESYSRVLESLAFNILSRIDDVLHADDLKKSSQPSMNLIRNASTNRSGFAPFLAHMSESILYGSPLVASSLSPISSPAKSPSLFGSGANSKGGSSPIKTLSEYIGWNSKAPTFEAKQDPANLGKPPPSNGSNKAWSNTGNINSLHSPPSRD